MSNVLFHVPSSLPPTRARRRQLVARLQEVLFEVIQAIPAHERAQRTQSLVWMRDVIDDARTYLHLVPSEEQS